MGLVVDLVRERYPFCFTILQLWAITSFTVFYQIATNVAGSKVFQLLLASAIAINIATDCYSNNSEALASLLRRSTMWLEQC
jgi:hypothetical protein